MALRIIALIPEASCANACLEAAAAAARVDSSAEILALHVKTDPMHIFSSDEEVAFQRLREPLEGTAEERACATKAEFDAWLASAPADVKQRIEYEELVGAEEETVLKESHKADLEVLARPKNLDGHDAFHSAIFLTHKPLLLAPAHWKAEGGARLERHMLFAWKQTPQARHALAGALPWLRAAERVTLLTVHKEGHELDPSEAISALEQDDVRVELMSGQPIDGRTSARILETAEEIGASSIVMGAYRFGTMFEWALGATTKRTITGTKIPLFLAH